MPREADWGHAVVVAPRVLNRLTFEHAFLTRSRRRLHLLTVALFTIAAGLGACVWWEWTRSDALMHKVQEYRQSIATANAALDTLTRGYDKILAATEHAPSVGTRSWGRRFTVTRYVPRSPRYGKFNDGLTATLAKADPEARIVAVDPKLIPYGSWVWIEDLGWFRAADCGSDIKGFRLDVLTATESESMAYGRQDRFAIVVPAEDGAAPTW